MRTLTAAHLATVHLALSALALLWNIYMAGRIARMPGMSRSIAFLSAVAGLVIAPALFVAVVSASVLSGRALHTLGWLLPATSFLMAVQSALSLARGMAAMPLVAPVLAYNLLLGVIYTTRFVMQQGAEVPDALIALSAAQTGALALAAHPLAIVKPLYLHVPLLAPASPGRRGVGTAARSLVAVLATAWLALIALKIPEGARAAHSYAQTGSERLQERPEGNFRIGLRILPTLSGTVPPLAVQSDVAMIDTTGVDVLSIIVAPEGARLAALEELAAALEPRRSGRTLIVGLELAGAPRAQNVDELERYLAARIQDLDRVTRVLRPDYVVPVMDPVAVGAQRLTTASPERWQRYITDARAAVRHVRPATRVIVHVGGFTPADSALHAWAAHPQTTVDAVGFSIFPGYVGASRMDARRSTAARWLNSSGSTREHWVLEGGAYPVTHGEENQGRALWSAIAWASSQPQLRGFVVHQASDYEMPTGLRAPGGRIRPAARRVAEAVRAFAEAAVPEAN